MTDVRDSSIHLTSETNHKNVVIVVDDLADKEEPANKDTSPSIESISVDHDHIAVPTQTTDDNRSSNSSIAQSTTILDVDDGANKVVNETANKTYKKLRENICLGVVIAIVCGIILTPVILYYTRPDISNPFEMATVQTNCQSVSSGLSPVIIKS